jgi:acyl-CoA ligase (AMP-forming) (exosortase A-associated)
MNGPYLLHHLLLNSAEKYPDKEAVIHNSRSLTYQQLFEESRKMAMFLKHLGLKKEARVAILLDKSIEQAIAFFGVSMAGGISLFINPILKKEQVEHILADSGTTFLLCTNREWQRNELDAPVTVIYMDEDIGNQKSSGHCWHEFQATPNDRGCADLQISDDMAHIIYTSGSTGRPKGIVLTHRNLIEGAEIVSSYLNISSSDRLISVLPFNFDYGLNQMTSSVLNGATLVLHKFFLPTDLLKVLEAEKITGFAGMNPIWVKIFNENIKLTRTYDFSHLRYITNSGGKVPVPIVVKIRKFFPTTDIYLMYGLTEAFRSTYLPPQELDRRPTSMGKAIPNVEIFVVNEKGEECKPGEVGELVHRGALISRGYWNDPEKTAQVFRKNPLLQGQDHLNEVVVFSGDLAKKDDEGFLYYISRRDEMIKTMGYRVSPTEVEETLHKIDGVADAVVFGKEIETGDQIVVAVVQLNTAVIEKNELLGHARKHLPDYMVPREVYFEKEFPKTANGKVDRSLLKQKYCALAPPPMAEKFFAYPSPDNGEISSLPSPSRVEDLPRRGEG